MSARLYEPCTACDANGKLHGVNQFGVFTEADCSCRGTKFQEVGLTVNQVERLMRKAEAMDRIARHTKEVDLARLDDAAGYLDASGHTRHSAHLRRAARAIADTWIAIKDAGGPLHGKEPEHG